jgi:two-component sensor histidine kinase
MSARPSTYAEGATLSLAMAVVASSPGPLLLLDGDLAVVAASASFAAAFGIDPADAVGRPFAALDEGEWDDPQLRARLAATAAGGPKIEAYEIDLLRPGRSTRSLVIHAQRLVYLDLENLRLIMAISDVTDLRADERVRDETLRQNLVLLQETRHRVANSLQIIASVLLQNAKKTPSDETRGHLNDAHSRVMSVAALERQLVGSGSGDVDLRVYFTSLCDCIAASMISDSGRLSLVVAGQGGIVDARDSVSLGLIVTELVINALKHAFPNGRGKITVTCDVRGPDWRVSVDDDGVGMPADPADLRAGLGTSIVQALARQLSATVQIAPGRPGTHVAITHAQTAPTDGAEDSRFAGGPIKSPAA